MTTLEYMPIRKMVEVLLRRTLCLPTDSQMPGGRYMSPCLSARGALNNLQYLPRFDSFHVILVGFMFTIAATRIHIMQHLQCHTLQCAQAYILACGRHWLTVCLFQCHYVSIATKCRSSLKDLCSTAFSKLLKIWDITQSECLLSHRHARHQSP